MNRQGLFGLYRYLLAVLVLIGHLWPELSAKAGTYAVFSFYILSGYLMTYVIRDVYGLHKQGIKRFLVNRFLRIYPNYYLVMFLTLVILSVSPPSGSFMDPAVKIPSDFLHWLVNIIIFGLAPGIAEFHMSGERLVSVAWSLHVELCFYVLMAGFLVRSNQVVHIWFAVGLASTIYMVAANFSWQDRYYTLVASSLPFSIGALLYIYRRKLSFLDKKILAVGVPFMYFTHAILANALYGRGPEAMGIGFYISLCLAAISIAVLSSFRVEWESYQLGKWDRAIGDLTYPLFLTHVIVGMLVSSWLGLDKGWALFVVTLILSSGLSWLMHGTIERKVEKARLYIRAQGN